MELFQRFRKTMPYSTCGAASNFSMAYTAANISFVHLAAFTGQQQYVLRDLRNNADLLHGNQTLHILYSAAFCNKEDLVGVLLTLGSSPNDQLECHLRRGYGRYLAPIWMVVTTQYVAQRLQPWNFGISLAIWIAILAQSRLDPDKFLILLGETSIC